MKFLSTIAIVIIINIAVFAFKIIAVAALFILPIYFFTNLFKKD